MSASRIGSSSAGMADMWREPPDIWGGGVYQRRRRGPEGAVGRRRAELPVATAGHGVEAEMRAWEQGCAGELALSRSGGGCHAAA
jgi:hypothetical protein